MSRSRPEAVTAAALCLSALVFLAAAPARAAEGDAGEAGVDEVFAERIEVSLVGLEVWVSDAEGEPVTGLGVDDFTLRHDGDPVTITHFSEVHADAAGEAAPAPPVASDPATAEPPPPGRL